MSSPINTKNWLEKQMLTTIQELEFQSHDKNLLKQLDTYISLHKKYTGSIDILGETIRVMEHFAIYTRINFPEQLENIQEIVHQFLQEQVQSNE